MKELQKYIKIPAKRSGRMVNTPAPYWRGLGSVFGLETDHPDFFVVFLGPSSLIPGYYLN
jgi:hypothetical protein